ncbi:MAG: SGNH/GDSL hydrolase family protein [Pirellulales bacterium]
MQTALIWYIGRMIAANPQQTTVENEQCLRTRIAPIHELLLGLSLLCMTVLSSVAGPFTQLVIFGDSLSDIGNVAQSTGGLYPGRYYYNNRFSNGPVYADALATGLGLSPPVHSRAGGDNFAHGGAKTSGTSFPNSLFIQDVDDQVGQFLATRTADPNGLFLVLAGANDLIGGQTNVSVPVNRLATDIGRLISAGASQLLVLNLPLLGYTPRFNGNPTTVAQLNSRTEQFNSALATMLDGLEATNPAISLYRFDVAALFSQALNYPAAFGLTNVTNPAAPGLQPGAGSYDTSRVAANPNEYMFWDDLHPTSAVHAILAERVLQLFALPGDFNDDNIVDASDYVVWRKGLGTTYTQTDYDVWRAHFGETAGSGSAETTTVPEPLSEILLALAMLCSALAIRRRSEP